MARLRATLVLAGVLALMAPAVDAAPPVRYTHRMSVDLQLVNRWTVTTKAPCALTGSGTLTLKLTASVPKVQPNHSRAQAWRFFTPTGGYQDIKPLPASGTLTREDNRVQNPPRDPTDTCEPEPKTGCGTTPARKMKIHLYGERRGTEVDVTSKDFRTGAGTCGTGTVTRWTDSVFWGRAHGGYLFVDMPAQRKLRRRSLNVTDSSHKALRGGEDVIYGDEVTRKVTLAFRRR